MALEQVPLTKVLGWSVQGDLGGWTFYTNKRRRLVFFPQAPPLSPPTWQQIKQRNKLRLFGAYWRGIGYTQRRAWRAAAQKASLTISGTALAAAYFLTGNTDWLATISRQTGINLPP